MTVKRQVEILDAEHTRAMRDSAVRFIDEPSLPRYEDVQRYGHAFHRDLWRLIPRIQQLTGYIREGDVQAKAALAGVGEAHRRLDEIERAGLSGEFERVKRLARSVVALCDHHENLTRSTS
ncbi:DUF6415 family natural product biosynthesis protein [Streptomyces sp. NBC_00576]|uniref:DUF6415 family natural product biosynthesis protein n=1 Tax=Streptomyces sp. NBC_00576 TaxID=2903665 RepID=UPI002E80F291|nr:DUF6415 family natural product biosynthesis protein [Streptomyces sp. NBC_00576]WUB72282.1 DUF6415 family natural product biosynthesis protein [Streptomyces sp. NBC_00576]